MLRILVNLLFGRPKYWIVRLSVSHRAEYEKSLSVVLLRRLPKGDKWVTMDGPYNRIQEAFAASDAIVDRHKITDDTDPSAYKIEP